MKKYEKEIRDLLEGLDGFVPEGSDNKKKGNAAPPDDVFADAARRERELRDAERQNVIASDSRSRSRATEVPPPPIPFPTKSNNLSLVQRLRTAPTGLVITVGAVVLGIIGIAFAQAGLPLIGQVIVIAAILVFLWPVIARFVARRAYVRDMTYWRGRPTSNARPSFFARLFGQRPAPGSDERSRSNFPNDDPWNKRRY